MTEKRIINVQRYSTIDGTILNVRRVIVKCCGEEMICEDFTNTCDICGRDYNSAGQELAPRSQWGEETGETWQDCYHGSLDD